MKTIQTNKFAPHTSLWKFHSPSCFSFWFCFHPFGKETIHILVSSSPFKIQYFGYELKFKLYVVVSLCLNIFRHSDSADQNASRTSRESATQEKQDGPKHSGKLQERS